MRRERGEGKGGRNHPGRRAVLTGLALPPLIHAANAAPAPRPERRIVFAPQAMPASLDPVATLTPAARTAGLAVFETLYGTDARQNPMPQMVQRHRVEEGGRQWVLQLRPEQMFHDGTPVTARDCVASLRRWMRRDRPGHGLAERLASLEATAGDVLTIRLKQPLPSLPALLSRSQPGPPVIMPARLAETDPATPVPEITGSGPFRLAEDSWQPGAGFRLVRFDRYTTRVEASSFTGGRRVALVDEVLWRDPADPLQALRDGTVDWVETLPLAVPDDLKNNRGLVMSRLNTLGFYAVLRLNAAHGPMSNPRLRQAVLATVDQTAVMETVFGAGSDLFRTPAGLFLPGSAFVNDAGKDRVNAKRSPRAIRALLSEAGYRGEKLIVLTPAGDPVHAALTAAVIEELRQAGLTIQERPATRQALDALRDGQTGRDGRAQEEITREVPGKVPGQVPGQVPGAVLGEDWSAFCDSFPGADHMDPSGIRTGRAAGPGWPEDPAADRARAAWIDTESIALQNAAAARLQEQVFLTVPFVTLGQWFTTAAWRTTLSGQQAGACPVFWNVARGG